MTTFRGLHQNFTNIVRFANRQPHMFATASFDHTCKVWDLRQPLAADRAAASFQTDTLNVMCTFSPDDNSILCSGVDSTLQQFSLAATSRGPISMGPRAPGSAPAPAPAAGSAPNSQGGRFPLPALTDDTNYRRSLYLASG